MLIHVKKPFRRNIKTCTTYHKYRQDLRKDFNQACGYCGDSDERIDSICFHIDHFAPQKRFPHLKTTYSNLVYACRFCNIRKSDHWIGDDPNVHNDGVKGFIDPCSKQYDANLKRDITGRIIGTTDLGCYIVKRLSLNLMRHQLLWQARRALTLREEVDSLIDRIDESNLPDKDSLLELFRRYRSLTRDLEQYEFAANN